MALLQLSMRYFADTGAPKEVIEDFVKKLLRGEEEQPQGITQDGNRLILPGQIPSNILRRIK